MKEYDIGPLIVITEDTIENSNLNITDSIRNHFSRLKNIPFNTFCGNT